MGDFEAVRKYCGVILEIPPLAEPIFLPWPLSGLGTLIGGEFDWGGRLLKSNGGAQLVDLRRMEIDVDVYSHKSA